jgi:hypothetical protein
MTDKTKYLTEDDLGTLAALCGDEFARKGESFYGWRDEPAAELDRPAADVVWKAKLDGAYGERFALSMILAAALVRQGKKIALLQKSKEPGLPFDAAGWCIMSVQDCTGVMHPIFHLAPWDLPMDKVAEAGLLTIVEPDSEEDRIHAWKGSNGGKPGDFAELFALVLL